jgi:hypothetical protein
MTDTDDLRQRLQAMATDIVRWRAEATRLRDATQLPGAATDDALLLSVEETSGEIYREIDTFDELVKDVDRTSHVAAGQVAEVGDALRLILMEITELGTGLYGLRSADVLEPVDVGPELVEFASSSNGDRWFLGPAEGNTRAFVEHRANEPSGGAVTRTSVATFLASKPPGPQHDALRTLLESRDVVVEASTKPSLDASAEGADPTVR